MSGIYIHIPFCKQACYYCDFHFSTSLKHKSDLVLALVKEIEQRKQELENHVITTIYFGGGTPSLLSIKELQLVLRTVYKNYKVSVNPEITLEANPDDLISTYPKKTIFEAYRSLGINRLSIGVQSFFETDLKLMNRAHNSKEALQCLEAATPFFDNISIDLIYGIPNATNKQWEENINTALSLGIPHISSYALTVEPKTPLDAFVKKGVIANVDDEKAQQQFYILVNKLEAEGFVHYELSNFGKPQFFSKNNSAYWQGKSYVGIGPSAHSFNGKQRSWNVRHNLKYIKALNQGKLPKETETLSVTDKYNEYVMTGLRTIWGVSLLKVEEEFGANYKNYLLQQAQKYIKKELLYIEAKTLRTTKKGKFLSDGIASDLFKLNL